MLKMAMTIKSFKFHENPHKYKKIQINRIKMSKNSKLSKQVKCKFDANPRKRK